jgi:hypothetical protein
MTYKYKGLDVSELLQDGTDNYISPVYYSGFPNYATSNYGITDRPLDMGFQIKGEPVSSYLAPSTNFDAGSMVATHVEYSTAGSHTAAVPSWANKVRVIAIGGGGGQGGGGGCGWGGVPLKRHNGGAGSPGAPGNYIAYTSSSFNVSGGNISVTVGAAGNNGGGGNARPSSSPGSGNGGSPGGTGESSNITYGSISINAGGGGGGGGGNGGNANDSNNATNNNLEPANNASNLGFNAQVSNSNGTFVNPPRDFNPVGYANNEGKYQTSGYVRIYFLKDQ